MNGKQPCQQERRGPEAAEEAVELAAQLRLCVSFPTGLAGGGAGPRTQLWLPPRLEALVGEFSQGFSSP